MDYDCANGAVTQAEGYDPSGLRPTDCPQGDVSPDQFPDTYSWSRTVARAPCNETALVTAEQFLDGSCRNLLVTGRQGTGKSFLLHCLRSALVRRGGPKVVRLYRADQWLHQRQPVNHIRALLVDDLHVILAVRTAAAALADACRTVVGAGGQVVVSAQSLPSPRERQRFGFGGEGWCRAKLRAPGLRDRLLLLKQMACRYELQIEEEGLLLVAERMRCGLHGLRGALNRLLVLRDHYGPVALTPARVAALLGPLESGGAYAELPEAVANVLRSYGAEHEEAVNLAAYLLCRYAGVTESVVADWLAVSGSRVHRGARAVETSARTDAAVQERVQALAVALDRELVRRPELQA